MMANTPWDMAANRDREGCQHADKVRIDTKAVNLGSVFNKQGFVKWTVTRVSRCNDCGETLTVQSFEELPEGRRPT
jgi:hypothetical protein